MCCIVGTQTSPKDLSHELKMHETATKAVWQQQQWKQTPVTLRTVAMEYDRGVINMQQTGKDQ
jgi:hypothetical protein